jgi:DNA-directed RNA polymerase specialized sigma24 family protein
VADIVDLERLISDKRKALSEYAMAIHARQMLVIHERNELERYINGIDDGYMRRVFIGRFVDGLSWAEIADRLGKDATEESVKKRFYRYVRKRGIN